MTQRAYPVLYGPGSEKPKGHPTWPLTVPWDFIAEHEQQCQHNHSQTATRLAERGGLGLLEIVAVVSGKAYREIPRMTNDQAAEWVNTEVAEWLADLARAGKEQK
jgi:hypothetical protein